MKIARIRTAQGVRPALQGEGHGCLAVRFLQVLLAAGVGARGLPVPFGLDITDCASRRAASLCFASI